MFEVSAFDGLASSSELATATFRAALRLELGSVEPLNVANEQIANYADCEQAYNDLTRRFRTAEDRLLHTLGMPEGFAGSHAAWLVGWRVLEPGRTVDVAYEVSAKVAAGRLDSRQELPLTVTTHLLHHPEHDLPFPTKYRDFRGTMTGMRVFKTDAIQREFQATELLPKNRYLIEDEAREELVCEGYNAALEPYAEQLVGLDHGIEVPEEEDIKNFLMLGVTPREVAYGFGKHGVFKGGRAVLRLLLEKPRDTQHATDILTKGLEDKRDLGDDDALKALGTLLDCPPEQLSKDLTLDGPQRFDWLAQNMGAMRRAMNEAARQKVVFGFHSVFMRLLKLEEPKVAAMDSLATGFQQQTLVDPANAPA